MYALVRGLRTTAKPMTASMTVKPFVSTLRDHKRLKYERIRAKKVFYSSVKIVDNLTPRCMLKIGTFFLFSKMATNLAPHGEVSSLFTVTITKWHSVIEFMAQNITSEP